MDHLANGIHRTITIGCYHLWQINEGFPRRGQLTAWRLSGFAPCVSSLFLLRKSSHFGLIIGSREALCVNEDMSGSLGVVYSGNLTGWGFKMQNIKETNENTHGLFHSLSIHAISGHYVKWRSVLSSLFTKMIPVSQFSTTFSLICLGLFAHWSCLTTCWDPHRAVLFILKWNYTQVDPVD